MRRKRGIVLKWLTIVLLVGAGCLVGGFGRNKEVKVVTALKAKAAERHTISEKAAVTFTSVIQEIIANRKATVVIDAGHGGEQPGCVVGGTLEKDVNLSIALALKDELEKRGIAVILTRNNDTNVQLSDRTAYARSILADYFVSIHCNAYVWDRNVRGFQCFYYQSDRGKMLSDEITRLVKEKEIQIRGAEEADFRVLRESSIPAVLIEAGYLTNYGDRIALTSREYQMDMAAIIAEGIDKILQS
ncbi:MAG: N-acetylmuramoyl-L-alanine amidase [Lachnospiraceae bacterium]